MSKYFIQPVVTNAGRAALTKAIATKEPITFTRLGIGSGRQSGKLEEVTALAVEKMTLPAYQTKAPQRYDFRVSGRLTNFEVEQEFTVTEIAVFAKVGADPEVLYMYTSAEAGDLIPNKREAILVRDYEFNVRLSHDGAAKVTYLPSTSTLAKKSEVNEVKEALEDFKEEVFMKVDGEALKSKAASIEASINEHKLKKDNPHGVTKAQVGLGNVTNVQQAPKTEFDMHKNDTNIHVTTQDKANWNGKISKPDFDAHKTNYNNPHVVTKAQVGLGNVDNVKQASKVEFDAHNSDNNRHVSTTEKATWNSKANGVHSHPTSQITGLDQKLAGYDSHVENKNNPHGVTKAQVGLNNVDNVKQAPKTEFDALKADYDVKVPSLNQYRINTGSAARYECPKGTDLATFLKGSTVPNGLYVIKDLNTNRYLRVVKQDSSNIYCDSILGDGHYIYVIANGQTLGWQQDGPVSGENSNGNWTKFPDGTLICWGLPRIDYGGAVYSPINTITFPMAFAKHPGISITPYLSPASESFKRLPGVNIVDQNLRNFSFTVGDNAGGRAGSYMWAYWIAIGRWK